MNRPPSKMHRRVMASKDERLLMDNERDKEKALKIIEQAEKVPPNRWWDDANEAFVEIHKTIVQANEMVLDHVQAAIADPVRGVQIKKNEYAIAATLDVIQKDIDTCHEQLVAVYETHKGMKGGATTPAELVKLFEVHAGYSQAIQLCNDNVMPLTKQLFEDLGEPVTAQMEAMEKLSKLADNAENLVIKHTQDPATDPSVVTDVEPKAPPADAPNSEQTAS